MAAALLRLATLIALVLMPIGMGMTSAVAATSASAMDEHCGGAQQDDLGKAGQSMHCSACAALPAQGSAKPPGVLHKVVDRAMPTAKRLLGTELEIATPPPKRA